mgnify:CR=1 FL=1
MDKIDVTVNCRLDQFRKETFRIYYVRNDGKWLPLPPAFCDQGNASIECQQCVADVINLALNEKPPFSK